MSEPLKTPRSSSAARVAAHRRRMRERGLVPKTIWVRDTTSPEFLMEYDRQARAIAANIAAERDTMDWIERVTADLDLGPIPDYVPPEKT